jgi:hypothetical protein
VSKAGEKDTARAERGKRLAAALKANIRRRKHQARARQSAGAEDKAGGSGKSASGKAVP